MTTTKRNPKMPVSKARNAYQLLAEIRKLILEEPKRYDQNHWLVLASWGHGESCRRGMPECGTVGCVAGWVVAMSGDTAKYRYDVQGRAAEILGLNLDLSLDLFDPRAAGDPEKGQTMAHAKRGAAHIKRFMEAHKAQLKAKEV